MVIQRVSVLGHKIGYRSYGAILLACGCLDLPHILELSAMGLPLTHKRDNSLASISLTGREILDDHATR